ncbi:MAG: hypothetical protein K6B46_04985 [Opitutales bacterium]|nr:hypothetical protein [Opitutales bacterium]
MLGKIAKFLFGPREAQKNAVLVFSPTQAFKGESKIVSALFREGLTFYHLRRPRWNAQQITAWVKSLPESLRERVILHQHPELVARLGLAGFCADSVGDLPSSAVDCGLRMAVCRSYDDICTARRQCAAVLVGPLFLNESRDKTVPARTAEELAATVLYFRKKFPSSPLQIFAYGGVNSSSAVAACRELACFNGFASMSGIWNDGEAIDNFKKLCKQW